MLPSEVRFERAKVLMLRGDMAGAGRELDEILAADPAFAPAKYLLGQVLFAQKEYARAASMFDAYLKTDPGSETAMRDLGVALALSGRCPEALTTLQEVLKTKPMADAENYYAGLCLLGTGKPADAVAPLKVAAGAPKSGFSLAANYYLAAAYLRAGMRSEAAAIVERLSNERLPADTEGPVQRLRASIAGGEREVRQWWVSIVAGSQYDTNVVMLTEGTPQEVRDITDQAAFRFFLMASGGYAPIQDERKSLSLSVDGYRSFHTNDDAAQFNLTSLQPSLYLSYRAGGEGGAAGHRHHLSGGYEYQLNMFDGGDLNDISEFGIFSQSHGLRLQWRAALPAALFTRARYQLRFAEFANDDRTNLGHAGGAGVGMRLWRGRAGLFLDAGLRYEDAENAFFDLASPQVSLSADVRLLKWLSLSAFASVEREDHFRVDRTDWIKAASVSVTLRPWERHSFIATHEWTDDASTDGNYTYSRHVTSLMYSTGL
ncbi:MAG: tetratricopeptide repeat protein [Deltaproteobacteria bacterium]|nr:tetratricopeptide repeat protein [Deltaproteobacteria bacterium]